MSRPRNVDVGDVVDLIQSYGPTLGPWVMAVVTIVVFVWLWNAGVRHMRSVFEMGESLRAGMKADKEKCEEECRRKDGIISTLIEQRQQLVEDHSAARLLLLQDAHELKEAHRQAMEDMKSLEATIHVLTQELEVTRTTKRRTDP